MCFVQANALNGYIAQFKLVRSAGRLLRTEQLMFSIMIQLELAKSTARLGRLVDNRLH